MKPLLIPLLLLLALTGCREESPRPAAAPADPALVTAPASLSGQLKVGTVTMAPVSEILRVSGRIDFDEQRVARIGAPVTGRVMELNAHLGDRVAEGQTLAQIHSTELSHAQLAYVKAKSQVRLQGQAVERARLLLSSDVIGAAELQRRENELSVAEAELRAAADQLKVLGVSPKTVDRLGGEGGINSVSSVVATLPGVVVERKVAKGQVVQPADALFTVADLSRLWVVAQVPEAQAARVRSGEMVDIEVAALAGKPVKGRLTHVGEIVNPETRTVMVRSEIDNKDRQLKPAMLATMLIQAPPVERLVVPASAVVREGNDDCVFVDQGKGAYRLVKLKLGQASNGLRVVESGLKAGDPVVVEGGFHLNNERKRKELEGT